MNGKQNPGRLSSEFKILPNGADLKAQVKCNQKTTRNTDTRSKVQIHIFPVPRSIPRIKPQLLLSAALRRLRVGLFQITRALLRQLSRCAHSTRSQMAQSAT